MTHLKHTPDLMGKHYYGTNPCINPLAMAELMLRLERRRKEESTLQPSDPFAKTLRKLVNRFL